MEINNPLKEIVIVFKKLGYFFNRKQKNKIILLLALLLFGMFLEVLSLSMVIPLITAILDPNFRDLLKQLPIDSSMYDQYTNEELIYIILVVLTFIFLFKTLFLIYLNYRQNRFIASVSTLTSNQLFEKYLGANYTFHINRNTAELMRNLQQEVQFFVAFFQAFITLIVECFLILSVVLTLIFIEPVGAISLGFFFSLVSFLFFQLTKRRLGVWGLMRQNLDGVLSKIILETLSSIKEIKVLGKEKFFFQRYALNNQKKAYVNALFVTVNLAPRHYLEFMSIFGLSSFISIMLIQGKSVAALITTVGVFIAAIFRVLPSVNKILSNIQVIKYKSYSLDILLEEFQKIKSYSLPDLTENPPFELKNSLALKSLDFEYEKHNSIFDKIELTLNKGEVIGIIGGSGVGKSTLIDVLLGLYPDKLNHLYLDNQTVENDVRKLQNNIGYVPQHISLLDSSIIQNIALGIEKNNINFSRVQQVVELAQLDKFINQLPKGLETVIGEDGEQLSGGQRQRIGIARALYHNPEILIFDEATSALDNKTEKDILNVIYQMQNDKTIIMVAHRLTTLEQCDKVFEIKNGKINQIDLSLIL